MLLAISAGVLALTAAPAAASADAIPGPPQQPGTPPPSIFWEELAAASFSCGANSDTATASGTAIGPYPGTFTATVTLTDADEDSNTTSLHESFTIDSPNGTVTGTADGVGSYESNGAIGCFSVLATYLPYSAVIHTSTGNYQTAGAAILTTDWIPFDETFSNDYPPGAPTLIVPTSTDQCKNAGWQNYPQFKNQGDCVSYVQNGR